MIWVPVFTEVDTSVTADERDVPRSELNCEIERLEAA